MSKRPILERIRAAFGEDEFEVTFATLARRVFPDPKSWRYSSNGGPPGCYMALSSAIRRYKLHEGYDQHDRRIVYRPSRTALAQNKGGENE